ncbi:MAG: hypothetical protein E6Q61_02565 [Nitrosomonas sp.]|nr:MAG: hypothetical protein E6Q61_02565 [Nitrosomonas sp.]
MKIQTVTLIGLVAVSASAMAEIPVSQYDQFKATETFKTYITGVGRGFQWANAMLRNEGMPPLYCAPDNVGFDQNDYLSLLENEVEKKNLRTDSPDAAVEMVLLFALKHAFPCGK